MWLLALSGYNGGDMELFNRHLIPPLIDMNDFGDLTDYPRLATSDVTSPELGDVAEYVNKLATVGFLTPDRNIEDHLREEARLPALEDEEADEESEDISVAPEEPGANGKVVAPGKNGKVVGKSRHYSLNDLLQRADPHQAETQLRRSLARLEREDRVDLAAWALTAAARNAPAAADTIQNEIDGMDGEV